MLDIELAGVEQSNTKNLFHDILNHYISKRNDPINWLQTDTKACQRDLFSIKDTGKEVFKNTYNLKYHF